VLLVSKPAVNGAELLVQVFDPLPPVFVEPHAKITGGPAILEPPGVKVVRAPGGVWVTVTALPFAFAVTPAAGGQSAIAAARFDAKFVVLLSVAK
jgi:hypothetical protein